MPSPPGRISEKPTDTIAQWAGRLNSPPQPRVESRWACCRLAERARRAASVAILRTLPYDERQGREGLLDAAYRRDADAELRTAIVNAGLTLHDGKTLWSRIARKYAVFRGHYYYWAVRAFGKSAAQPDGREAQVHEGL